MNWPKDLSGKIKFNEPLSKHTTFRIGGTARFFFQPKDINDLKRLVIYARKNKIRIFIIAGGSNLLIIDKGINGIVVKLDSPAFNYIKYAPRLTEVGARLPLSSLIKHAADNNLGGSEFLAGIPGTVGGALVMNAGISQPSKSISDLVADVTVMDYNGRIKLLKKDNIRFAYRASSLYNYIILKAYLRLKKSSRREIRENLRRYLSCRRNSTDYSSPSAGCIFKNPQGISAGRLIDLCGLKGKHFGAAAVSKKHANFILNKGRAKAKDVLRLMGYIQKAVKQKFAVNLEPEIKVW